MKRVSVHFLDTVCIIRSNNVLSNSPVQINMQQLAGIIARQQLETPSAPIRMEQTYWGFSWTGSAQDKMLIDLWGDSVGDVRLLDSKWWSDPIIAPMQRVFLVPKVQVPDLQKLQHRFYDTNFTCIQLAWGKLLAALIGSLTPDVLDDICSRPQSGRRVLERQVLTLLRLTVDAAHCSDGQIGKRGATLDERRRRFWQQVLIWMQDNFSEPGLSVGMAAETFNVSVRYIYLLFAQFSRNEQHEKETFQSVLNRLRLEHAASLLKDMQEPELTIAEVAWQCGYTDPVYFGKVFKQRFGQSPGRMRHYWQQLLQATQDTSTEQSVAENKLLH